MYATNKQANEYIRRAIGLSVTKDEILVDQDSLQRIYYKHLELSTIEGDEHYLFNPSNDLGLIEDLLRYQLYKLTCLGEIKKSFFIEMYKDENIKIVVRDIEGNILESRYYNDKLKAYTEIILLLGNIDVSRVNSLIQ